MSVKGDPDKKPDVCKATWTKCLHIKEVSGGMEGEWWSCKHCGAHFFLDYEEMQ